MTEEEAIRQFVFKVSMEGLEYAMENYPPDEGTPEDLRQAVEDFNIRETRIILESYMNKHDLEYD